MKKPLEGVTLKYDAPSKLENSYLNSGIDVYCSINEPITIQPGETMVIPTKTYFEIPYAIEVSGFKFQLELQARPRSSTSTHGLLIHLGTIDWSYRGEVGVIVTNVSNHDIIIKPNSKIAQIVMVPIIPVQLVKGKKEEFEQTERGTKGFGSTGVDIEKKTKGGKNASNE